MSSLSRTRWLPVACVELPAWGAPEGAYVLLLLLCKYLVPELMFAEF